MAITIKNPEALSLLAELTSATGRDGADLVLDLLRREMQRMRNRRIDGAAAAEARMAALHRELAALPVRDARPPDAILGYDDHGLPR